MFFSIKPKLVSAMTINPLTITLDHVFNNDKFYVFLNIAFVKLVSAMTINPLTITLDHVFNNKKSMFAST